MIRTIVLVLAVLLGIVGLSSVFIVTETEYAIKFQLGRVVRADYEPGLHFKLPFVNNVRKYDRRLLTLDTNAEKMLTSEQKFVAVDSFLKWHIVDPRRFYTATQGNEQVALSRLDSIVKDRIRNQIASRTLAEVVSEQRVSTMQDITRVANEAAQGLGIEVVDVRIKAIELPDDVRERMVALAAEHLVAQVAGVVVLVRLDQRDLDRVIGTADVLGGGRTGGAATDNHHLFLASSNGGEADRTDGSSATRDLDEISTVNFAHDSVSPLLLAGKELQQGVQLVVTQSIHLLFHLLGHFPPAGLKILHRVVQVRQPLAGQNAAISRGLAAILVAFLAILVV